MTISGIGIDLCEIERMSKSIDKDTDFLFRKKVFSESEIKYCEKMPNKAQHYAARFAAKEAFIKASGNTKVTLKDISTENKVDGNPYFRLSQKINNYLQEHSITKTHLSLTHTKTTAAAVVIVE